MLTRPRAYRIFYNKKKYTWAGPRLRALLKLIAPHQKLEMNADDCYFMSKKQLVSKLTWPTISVCFGTTWF